VSESQSLREERAPVFIQGLEVKGLKRLISISERSCALTWRSQARTSEAFADLV
jgi:hypothetical protein